MNHVMQIICPNCKHVLPEVSEDVLFLMDKNKHYRTELINKESNANRLENHVNYLQRCYEETRKSLLETESTLVIAELLSERIK